MILKGSQTVAGGKRSNTTGRFGMEVECDRIRPKPAIHLASRNDSFPGLGSSELGRIPQGLIDICQQLGQIYASRLSYTLDAAQDRKTGKNRGQPSIFGPEIFATLSRHENSEAHYK